MPKIRYESVLVEQALAPEYAAQMKAYLRAMQGLNDIKPLIREFERDLAAYIGVKRALAVNSGSDALAMILRAAGVGKGDEVIIPNLTYHAVALAVVYAGATPVLVDADARDLNLDVAQVSRAVTKRTKAVIAAHMFGRPCALDALQEICRRKGLVLIEDVCQAESSTYNGKMLGSFGAFAAFSFSYYKPLSSCGGGGGMVVCNEAAYQRIGRWMDDWRNDPGLLKLGQRFAPMSFMDLVALRVKFTHLKKIVASRKKIKMLYEKELGCIKGLQIFTDPAGADSVPQNFVVCCDRRDACVDFLADNGIVVQKPYMPLHLMSAHGYVARGKYPVSDAYYRRALHLPIHSFMSQDKALRVVEGCRKFMTV